MVEVRIANPQNFVQCDGASFTTKASILSICQQIVARFSAEPVSAVAMPKGRVGGELAERCATDHQAI